MPVPANAFGMEMTRHLIARRWSLTQLRAEMVKGRYTVSLNHVSDISRSHRMPTPEFIAKFVKVLGLNRDEARRLHRAACLDRGYDIGQL